MHPYIELNAHHIGKSHVQNGLLCEDYSATYSDDQVSIVVISDGHGDKNCFRSDKGARYACEIAISLCRRFQNITNHIDDIDQCDFESLVVSLESDIADAWRDKVLSDANAHPFSYEELLGASEQAQGVYRSGQRLEKAYGCTLIFSMNTANYWLSIQIGDGKSIAAYNDGVFVEPVPSDENCLGNRSTSLCNSNAKESFRHYYSKVKPIAAFVSSDGVEESFDQAGLYNFFFSLAYWVKEEGFDGAKAKIDNLLPQISEGGSGDDMSVAIMVSTEDAIAKPRQTLDQIYERVNACESALIQCKKLLADTNDRISEKNKERSALENDIAKRKAELEEIENAYTQVLTEQEVLLRSADELEARTQRASEQIEKATKYKASAERYWFAEFEKIGLKYRPPAEENDEDDVSGKVDEPLKAVSHKEKAENDVPHVVNADHAIVVEIPEETQKKSVEQENDIEPMLSTDTEISVAFSNPIETLTQEQHPEEPKDKQARHFWPFGKQPRQ